VPALFILILSTFVVGLLGTTRRIGFWWAVLASWLLTPIGGVLLVLFSGKKNHRRRLKKRK